MLHATLYPPATSSTPLTRSDLVANRTGRRMPRLSSSAASIASGCAALKSIALLTTTSPPLAAAVDAAPDAADAADAAAAEGPTTDLDLKAKANPAFSSSLDAC